MYIHCIYLAFYLCYVQSVFLFFLLFLWTHCCCNKIISQSGINKVILLHSAKHSSNSHISCNVNFEPTFLEKSRWYLLCPSLWCPHFLSIRNKKDITEFSKVSCYPVYEYLADNHYISFKNPAYGHLLKLFTFL